MFEMKIILTLVTVGISNIGPKRDSALLLHHLKPLGSQLTRSLSLKNSLLVLLRLLLATELLSNQFLLELECSDMCLLSLICKLMLLVLLLLLLIHIRREQWNSKSSLIHLVKGSLLLNRIQPIQQNHSFLNGLSRLNLNSSLDSGLHLCNLLPLH